MTRDAKKPGSDEMKEIIGSIDELANRAKISRSRAFAAWFAINFYNIDEDDALEAAAADGGNDQGIDIVFADDTSQDIVVLQAHCPETFSSKTPKNKWDAVISSLPFIKDPDKLAKSGRPDLAELIADVKTAHPEYTIAVGLIALGEKSNEIVTSVNAHNSDESHPGIHFFLQQQRRYQK